MAPEQVRGQEVDHRADIFALGAVLYEMPSGQRAFRGATTADTITAILKEDPPDLPLAERRIPPALARIVDRCIQKNLANRFGTAGDLGLINAGKPFVVLGSGHVVADSGAPQWKQQALASSRVAWSVAAVLLTACAALAAVLMLRVTPPEPAKISFEVDAPPGSTGFQDVGRTSRQSPDRTRLPSAQKVKAGIPPGEP